MYCIHHRVSLSISQSNTEFFLLDFSNENYSL